MCGGNWPEMCWHFHELFPIDSTDLCKVKIKEINFLQLFLLVLIWYFFIINNSGNNLSTLLTSKNH